MAGPNQGEASALRSAPRNLEIWGGVEYTCNRVRDVYFDQMELSGHAQRPGDYAEFSRLGIRTLRVGLLWERHEVDPSWRWADQHLDCLREQNIRPIVGLVHHGSGPQHTSLLDPEFPEKLAAYAGAVAERYPWIDAYTPVNEPNTTARFSGMYGVWYPHHMSRESYLRALFNQLKGTVLSMQAIRRVQPQARLIQTDDIGNISGTEELRSTWETLNLRQFLPYDLLCGRVDRQHPLFDYMVEGGIPEADIFWFAENPCPPAVIGVNYYVTSDRYLDHRLDLYSSRQRSAEGPFVDVEAVRYREHGIVGLKPLLAELWERYELPLAITEVHIGCSVDEQIRWFAECYDSVVAARRRGVNCVALTAWALLGSFFWNQLVTCDNGHYEPGVFDLRDGIPVATDLAEVIAQAAAGRAPHHPALDRSGWWHHPERFCFPCGQELAAPDQQLLTSAA